MKCSFSLTCTIIIKIINLLKRTITLKSNLIALCFFLCSSSLFSQTVQITSSTFPNPAATSCTNTFVDAGVLLLCINATFNGSTVNVSGNVIDVDLIHTLGPICLGALSQTTHNINMGMLPANTYTVNVNGFLNGTSVSTMTSTLTVVSCCSASPAFSLSNSDTICEGDSIAFSSLGAGLTSTKWYENNVLASSGANFGKRFNSPGAYQIKLVASDASCSDSLTKTIQVNAIPSLDLGADTAICSNESYSLWALNADSVIWSDGSTADSLWVDTAGTYSAMVYSGGCSIMDEIVISLIQPPMVNIGSDTTLCMGDSLVLDATLAGGSYLWQDNSTSSSLVARDSGTYWVQVKAANGCVSTASLIVTIDTSCTVSLNENRINPNFSLFPNPVKDKLFFTIDLKENEKINVQILDTKGQLLMEKTNVYPSSVNDGFDVSSLPKGFYILSLSVDSNQYSKAFVKAE